MSTTARNLAIRLTPELAERLRNLENATGIEGVTLGRILLNAALDYFENHEELPLPLAVVPLKRQTALPENSGS